MMFNPAFILALATLLGGAGSTPVMLHQNGSLLLDQRDTPIPLTNASLADLKFYVQYAAAAYCNADPSRVNTAIDCGLNACPTVAANAVKIIAYLGFKQSQVEGYVGIDSVRKEIIIAYKGSENYANYIADFLVVKDSCEELVDGCKVHKGFNYAWGDVKSKTLATVEQVAGANPTYRIVFVGHSLGGAVALIGAAHLRKAGFPCDVYTYGSPRVGNQDFVDFVDSQPGSLWRVTHINDYVPRYPPRLLGFRHTSPEFWLANGGDSTVDYGLADIQVCTGTSNDDCNGGQSGFDLSAHGYYFQLVSACK